MDAHALTLLAIALGALLGVSFTLVPLLPGSLFPLAAMAATGAIHGWDRVPTWAWVVQVVAVVASFAVDNVAQALGVRRLGGSRRAMLGGALGVFAGPLALAPLLGPLALVAGPPVGAIVGTLLGERSARTRAANTSVEGGAPVEAASYRRLGVGALAAYVLGTATKLSIIAGQVIVLVLVAR